MTSKTGGGLEAANLNDNKQNKTKQKQMKQLFVESKLTLYLKIDS